MNMSHHHLDGRPTRNIVKCHSTQCDLIFVCVKDVIAMSIDCQLVEVCTAHVMS